MGRWGGGKWRFQAFDWAMRGKLGGCSGGSGKVNAGSGGSQHLIGRSGKG